MKSEHLTTPEEFADKMRKIPDFLNDLGIPWDNEDSHMLADQYLCDMLRELGYDEGVDIFEAMKKWYA